jgi:hypothetical protein
MDLIKQYIIQSISAASNNLRLNTQKIEVVALLRESIAKSVNLESDIKEMKKVTEISKFAIRLHEIYNYLNQPFVDFFRISEKFKEHSQYLIRDLSNMLDIVNPVTFKQALDKIHPVPETDKEINIVPEIDLSSREKSSDVFEKEESDVREPIKSEDHTAEKFRNFEKSILTPIKPIDNYLQNMSPENYDKEILKEFISTVRKNADVAAAEGFEIIEEMHRIILNSLELILSGQLLPDKNITESIRACLIVIVAVVKGKEININSYLERAEAFGNHIKTIK